MLCLLTYLICTVLLLGFAWAAVGVVWPTYLVLALLGMARAFQTPAAQSFVPNIVPLAALPNAIAVSSSTFQIATILGPSVGGLVYAFGASSQGTQGSAASGTMLGTNDCAAGVWNCLLYTSRCV